MKDFKSVLEDNGKTGVELYKQSLIDNDRVATGDTLNSIRFEADEEKLTIYASDHIKDLETGQTANDIQQKGDFFDQLDDWVKARGLGDSVVTGRIYDSLQKNGWNNTISGRNEQGGTDGIITNPTDTIIENTKKDVKKVGKFVILSDIKRSLNANNRTTS